MNKKSWMVLAIVAGLYLVFLGVQIISQVTKEQPNNLALMICAAVLFIGVGVVYAGAAISSVWKMSRGGEKSQEDDLQIVEKEDSMETFTGNTKRDSGYSVQAGNAGKGRSKRRKEAPIDRRTIGQRIEKKSSQK